MAQHYRYMVCKGSRTVALATTQREAEAEAARVGGEVYALEPTRNPLDPDYSIELGKGAFSSAYAREDVGGAQRIAAADRAQKRIKQIDAKASRDRGFYFHDTERKPLDRRAGGVEAVTIREDRSKVSGLTNVIDVSKLILALARDELKAKGKRAALAFLPAIRPLRMDLTSPTGRPELIYKMPVYRAWMKGGEGLANETAQAVFYALNRDASRYRGADGERLKDTAGLPLDKTAEVFSRNMKHMDPATQGAIAPVSEALHAIHKIAHTLPLEVYSSDAHGGNFAVDKNGHLILLDVFFAEMLWEQAAELWNKLKKRVKKAKAPKAAKAPKKAKTAKPATAKPKTAKPKTAKPAGEWVETVERNLRTLFPLAQVDAFVVPLKVQMVQGAAYGYIAQRHGAEEWLNYISLRGVPDKDNSKRYSSLEDAFAHFVKTFALMVKTAPIKAATIKPKTAKPATAKPATAKKLTGWAFAPMAGVGGTSLLDNTANVASLVNICAAIWPPAGQAGPADKGYGREWIFKAPNNQVFTVYERWGIPNVGGKPGLYTVDDLKAWLQRHAAKPKTAKPKTAKPATVKPKTAKPKAAKKAEKMLKGKKLDALVSNVFHKAFNRIAIDLWDIPKINDELVKAYERAADHDSGVRNMEQAAAQAVIKYGKK